MSDPGTCPDCDHLKGGHSPMVGCLTMEDGDPCDCDRSFREDKSREQMTAERDQAMGQAQQGTDPGWKVEAAATVRHLARRGADFTPDDVWVRLEELRIPPPREPRALGPILKRLANADVIRAKGFTESNRRHGAPVRIYEAGPNL
jgi:hypothetical protein